MKRSWIIFLVLLTCFADFIVSVSLPVLQTPNQQNSDRNARQLNRVTATVTTTRITTVTKRTTVAVACAKFVNVTGVCRHRNGRWLDEPQILSFDEDTDKLVDILYITPVYSVEATKTPNFAESPVILASAIRNSDEIGSSRQARIFFREFADFFQRFIPRLTTTTVTVTQEQTKCQFQTMTTTNTFFVQKCTPSPFPYQQCPHRHTTTTRHPTSTYSTKTRHPTSTHSTTTWHHPTSTHGHHSATTNHHD